MTDYRRGFEFKQSGTAWQKLWHFNERCERYPTRNFESRKDRPPDEELCARCNPSA